MDIEDSIYRIINGYYLVSIDNITYKIISPNISIKQNAHHIYLKTIDENKYSTDWLNQKQITLLLQTYGLWIDSDEKQLKILEKQLHSTKISLFKKFFNTTTRSLLKDNISNITKSINELYNKKYYFDYLTLEFYAQNLKNQYLITNMIYSVDNEKVINYDNLDQVDSLFLEKLLIEVHKHSISMDTIKQIARHDIWKSFWNIGNSSIFPGTCKDWTDEQRSLVNFSKTLDSIREHMEAPPSELMDDDDALEGWILYQNDKYDKERKKKQLTDKNRLNNGKEYQETFIITDDTDEAEEIMNLNDEYGKKYIKDFVNMSDQPDFDMLQLPLVQQEIREQYKAMMEGKR